MGRRLIAVCISMVLASCDNDEQNAALQGGGPGSSVQNDVVASGEGFCDPQGGSRALGASSWSSGVTTAKIDTDGNPLMQGHDATWQADTSGHVNGEAVDSSKYAYVVMSKEQMKMSGVSIGDWATVTNTENGKAAFARVEDRGPDEGTGEISQAAATAVGIQYMDNSSTVGDPSVVVQAYAGTASIEGNCVPQLTSS